MREQDGPFSNPISTSMTSASVLGGRQPDEHWLTDTYDVPWENPFPPPSD